MARYPRGTTAGMSKSPKAGNPKARYAADRNPSPTDKPIPVPRDSHMGAIQPVPNPNWHKLVKAWWKALGMSDSARVYQEIDWVNAWVAADLLHQMYEYGFTAGLYKEWQHTVEWLHNPRLDLLGVTDETSPEDDSADSEARAATLELVASLEDDDDVSA